MVYIIASLPYAQVYTMKQRVSKVQDRQRVPNGSNVGKRYLKVHSNQMVPSGPR